MGEKNGYLKKIVKSLKFSKFSAGADRAREMDNFFAHLEAKYAELEPEPKKTKKASKAKAKKK